MAYSMQMPPHVSNETYIYWPCKANTKPAVQLETIVSKIQGTVTLAKLGWHYFSTHVAAEHTHPGPALQDSPFMRYTHNSGHPDILLKCILAVRAG